MVPDTYDSVEDILKSRPLTVLTTDPSELPALFGFPDLLPLLMSNCCRSTPDCGHRIGETNATCIRYVVAKKEME